MEEYIAALAWNTAPGEKSSKWHQQSMKRVLSRWEQERQNDLELVLDSQGFNLAVGYYTFPTDVGEYGYDTHLEFRQDTEEHLLDEIEAGHLVEPFYEDWIETLQEVIQEDQEDTLFSPKEYATFLIHRHPAWHEARAADALDISIGTYRGKVGRVKSKLETARSTVELDEFCSKEKKPEFWEANTHEAALSVIHRVNESRLPVDSITHVSTEGVTLDDLPLDDLLRE